ncbi:protein phosphatase 2A regulatory subunit, putative [Leishmania panamensis]|uniref:protein phosphatase 2A regulatory subunit, putative n=1 Tax=Leishmania panamensis TaxID=5679 RepID=UPI0004F75814|nr:protein phosphatase 2A regulatory subunit, putative [Leishmania panamensis]AIO01365.1 protein phosphatase 2A regulatory subunit, putative [Leishmania panamensis]
MAARLPSPFFWSLPRYNTPKAQSHASVRRHRRFLVLVDNLFALASYFAAASAATNSLPFMLPKLHLDGTLNKRTFNVQERMSEERQPGMYSPRVASSQPTKGLSVPSQIDSATSAHSSSSSFSAPAHTGSLSSPHPPPHEISLLEDGAVGISDPEMAAILAAKSRHSSGERSPPLDRLGSIGGGMGPGGYSHSSKRRAAPFATLVDHQQARQVVPQHAKDGDVTAGKASDLERDEDGRVSEGASPVPRVASTHPRMVKCRATSPSTSSRASGRSTSAVVETSLGATSSSAPTPSAISIMTAEELYILGKPFQAYMSTLSTRPSSGDTPATPTSTSGSGAPAAKATVASGTHITTVFHHNPSQYISALANQGDFVAVGDRTGRVVVMRQRAMAAGPRRTLLDIIQRSGEAEESEAAKRHSSSASSASSPPSTPRHATTLNHVRDPYDFYVAQQAYVPVIDTLSSVEVSPTVMALAFLPQSGPTTYLLTANEKVPKLYKIMSVRESANPFRAVDKIGTKSIGPLTASSRMSTVTMKPVSRYAMNHEYNINSICPIAYSDQFATADDATVLLWCTEYPDTSIETHDLRSPYEDGPRETIRTLRNFPHEPFLFFVATSGGSVRVVDTRQTLRWAGQAAQAFVNPPREEDGPFSNVTNSVCDCALSPSGRYIAGRDFMSVCLWDIRMAGNGGARNSPASPRRQPPAARGGDGSSECSMVRRWALHPHLCDDLDTIYQSNLLFDKFDVQFLSSRQVCTGGFNNTLYAMDVESISADTASDIRTFQLLKTDGISEFRRTTVSAHRLGEDRISTGQGLGSRMTLMSRPCMSMSGTCGMMVACGQALLQFSYNGLLK